MNRETELKNQFQERWLEIYENLDEYYKDKTLLNKLEGFFMFVLDCSEERCKESKNIAKRELIETISRLEANKEIFIIDKEEKFNKLKGEILGIK